MIDFIEQIICLFLVGMSFLFIIVEFRARLDKSFLIFGFTNLMLAGFCAIDIWLQPLHQSLGWTKVQHIIGAFFPAFLLWYLMVLLNRINRLVLQCLFILGSCFALLFIANLMLIKTSIEAISTLLYNLTFAPYMITAVVGVAWYLAMNTIKSNGKEKKALLWHLVGLTALGTSGMLDMINVMIGTHIFPQLPSFTILGLLVYGLIVTFVFADRLSALIKDREITVLKLQDACHDLEAALPLARIGQSVVMVNHKIKNKAFAVSATLHSLKRISFPPAVREKIDQCTERACAIGNFSRDLLAQTGPSATRKRPMNLIECIKEAIRSFPDSNQDLFSCVWPDLELKVPGDLVKLQCTFENLFINSIQAGATHVQVRVTVGKRVVIVAIEDDGSGCDKKTADALFSPFFTTKKDQHGTGLGLSAARTIAENHGGSISAYSKNLLENGSRGMIVVVALPLPESSVQNEKDDDQVVVVLDKDLKKHSATIGQILHNAHVRHQMVAAKKMKKMNVAPRITMIISDKSAASIEHLPVLRVIPLFSLIAMKSKQGAETIPFTEESAVGLERT